MCSSDLCLYLFAFGLLFACVCVSVSVSVSVCVSVSVSVYVSVLLGVFVYIWLHSSASSYCDMFSAVVFCCLRDQEIGRASCRERMEISGDAVLLIRQGI